MDYLIKAIAYDGKVRAYAARTTDMVNEAQRRHDTWPTASAAIGRTMTASLMLGAMLKGEDKLTVKIEGGGPIGAIVADANAKGEVRAYVSNPHVHFDLNEQGKLDVRRAVGTDGTLSVVKDLGLRDYFTGQVEIVSGELGDDFTYYLVSSEQVPSSVGVGVLVNPDNTILAAGGFIIQLLPGTDEETISTIEKQLSQIEPISKLIQKGLTPEEILEEVLGQKPDVLETMPVKFHCSCSKDRFETAILGLGKKEIQDMIEEDGKAEAVCHFCNEKYLFTKEELEELRDETTR
ncbi:MULTISPECIES: Hsp33 family molecular chaperone HslO [Bacillus]|jgi:molecular chaperone Hsp33|uniref:33 kDa chaperonin n=3 Tax=Bacillus velezensis TaxID=492670 RepID=HSLO_BACVZ|nr:MULTISPECIES: Hsp33 family molecular chaperone HslO [Bacillus]A7Z0J4.1 RecName: Full=33 kDa chaperonin; AltName: Full=Heat shock protein 33 homolog; Short=HSP33 [Bacillus velezensis FZB42]AIW28450.1 heat shock protein Hsp33 [Bacillus subtilis]SLC48187.1 Heat shock protein 33 homolog [Mycobacteroides abscessus subsp. massiliense]ABS72520.1 Hsp33 family molecular chaperone HslO [Bacillus velezensis FZB42]AFJ60169.1 HSP33-like chaperonin [Bacillus velezensis YAU B9601-Y2]AFZ89119.1 Hsp33-like